MCSNNDAGDYGSNTDVPVTNLDDKCFYSDAGRARSSIDCARTPDDNKRRICYCCAASGECEPVGAMDGAAAAEGAATSNPPPPPSFLTGSVCNQAVGATCTATPGNDQFFCNHCNGGGPDDTFCDDFFCDDGCELKCPYVEGSSVGGIVAGVVGGLLLCCCCAYYGKPDGSSGKMANIRLPSFTTVTANSASASPQPSPTPVQVVVQQQVVQPTKPQPVVDPGKVWVDTDGDGIADGQMSKADADAFAARKMQAAFRGKQVRDLAPLNSTRLYLP